MVSYKKQKQRFERIHLFIRRKGTGCPDEFARKLNINVSTLYRYIKYMKEDWEAQIVYSKEIESYKYIKEFELPV